MSIEAIHPPVGDLSDRSKTTNAFRKNREVFEAQYDAVKSLSPEARISRQEIMQSTVLVYVPEVKPTQPDLLKGAGFTASEEANSLKQKFNEGLAQGLNSNEVVNRIVTENLTNIRWYQWEYTMSDPILPNPVAQNAKGELVNSKSGYSILDMTSEGERDGSVKQSVKNAQDLLRNSKEGDAVMIVSPPGWTGRVDEKGKEMVYPEAEIFAFIKGEGRNIRALTFISELTLDQCEQFREAFIVPNTETANQKLTEREKIAQMISSPILVTGGRVRFEDILDKVQAIKGGNIMREANGANRTFTEAREFLARGEEIQKLPDLCEEIIETYEVYLRQNIENINNPDVFNAIKQRMEMTVLEIAKILKGDKKEDQKEISSFYKQAMFINNVLIIDQSLMNLNYNEQIAYLRTRPGCNGGSSTNSGLFGSSLSEILSGNSNIVSFNGAINGSIESGVACKVCRVSSATEGGCGYCNGCAAKAA